MFKGNHGQKLFIPTVKHSESRKSWNCQAKNVRKIVGFKTSRVSSVRVLQENRNCILCCLYEPASNLGSALSLFDPISVMAYPLIESRMDGQLSDHRLWLSCSL